MIMKLNDKHYKILKGSRLFKGLKEDEIEEALKIFSASFAQYEKGDVLHQVGSPVKKFGLVLNGTVSVCSDDIGGSHIIMASIDSGKTFGEALCYLKIREPVMYAEAAENVSLLWLSPGKLFRKSADAKADVVSRKQAIAEKLQKNFTAMLAERMLAMNDRIQILSRLTLREKLITYFSEMSLHTGSSTFNIPFNREDMAVYLGTNRSALSRELANMKAEGLIDFYKNSFKILK